MLVPEAKSAKSVILVKLAIQIQVSLELDLIYWARVSIPFT